MNRVIFYLLKFVRTLLLLTTVYLFGYLYFKIEKRLSCWQKVLFFLLVAIAIFFAGIYLSGFFYWNRLAVEHIKS